MVMEGTAGRLIPPQGGEMPPAVVVGQPMDGALRKGPLRKGPLREVGARQCLLQGGGRCRPASGDATSAS
jgi:hypothetical protein